VALFAGLEGILFDQVYTGKAAAALLDYAMNGSFKSGPVVWEGRPASNGIRLRYGTIRLRN